MNVTSPDFNPHRLHANDRVFTIRSRLEVLIEIWPLISTVFEDVSLF